jgi:hypothetical protein
MRENELNMRRGTAAQWRGINPILATGEPGFESDTKKLKFGDGTTAWNSLPYFHVDGGELSFNCTEAPGKPISPEGGSGSTAAGYVKFWWMVPASTGGGISNYVMQRAYVISDKFGQIEPFNDQDLSWTDVPFASAFHITEMHCEEGAYNTLSFYRIAAVNPCGQGPWSNSRNPGFLNNCSSSSSSSSGTISCPAPWMNILLSDGSLVPAGELKVGMSVRTNHEETMEMGSYDVTHVSTVEAERIQFKIGDLDFVCSKSHKFYMEGSWKEAESLRVGDLIGGKRVDSIENIGFGEVVKITVDSAHTYVCEGLLSHNKTPGISSSSSDGYMRLVPRTNSDVIAW